MNATRPLSFQPYRRAGAGRCFRLALAVSVLFHLLIAAALMSESPHRDVKHVSAARIAARLEPRREVMPEIEIAPAAEEPQKSSPSRRAPINSDDAWRGAPLQPVSAGPRDAVQSPALPQPPDLTVYAARDLDSYPRPVVPLDLEQFADRAAGIPPAGIRLELIIDERGIVNHVAHAEVGTPGTLESELRDMIAASRFIPARKDGRAVKSRVLISVGFRAGERER